MQPSEKLTDIISGVSVSIGGAQLALDRQAEQDRARWLEDLATLGPISPECQQIAKDLFPPAQRLTSLSVAVSLVLEHEERREASVGLSLLGRNLTTFHEQRYGSRLTQASQLEIHCSAIAVREKED